MMERGMPVVGGNYLIPVLDEWIVKNPLWRYLAPEVVAEVELRIAERETPTTPTKEST
jgi:hypothetical protein